MFGRLPPVWSPLSLRAVVAGVAPGDGSRARARLEAALRADFGAIELALTGSGTVALVAALRAVAAGRPPVVALPAYACYDLATAADGAGATVVLYDLDPTTLAPAPASLATVVAAGVDAVLVAHLYGVPVDLAWVRKTVGPGPLLIDDAAQSAGASLAGRPLGGAGDLGVLSFGRGKGRTGGRGGALLATTDRGREVLERAAALLGPAVGGGVKDLVAVSAQWLLGRPALYGIPAGIPALRLGETIYHPPPELRGMPAAALAVAAANLDPNRHEDAARRGAGAWWSRELAAVESVRPITLSEAAVPGWLRYPVVVAEDRVAEFAGRAFRALGVMPGYPKALVDLPGFEGRWRDHPVEAPGARRLAARLFTLPTHSRVSPRRRDALLGLIRGFA